MDSSNIKTVFIPFNTPSSKNSKIATSRGVFHSKLVRAYLKNIGIKEYSVTKRTIKYEKGASNAFPVRIAGRYERHW